MTPIERVARAICAAAGNPKREPPGILPRPGRDYDDVDWERYEDHARAALEAARDAFDESGMVEAARQMEEMEGSEAAARASAIYGDVIGWFDAQIGEGA